MKQDPLKAKIELLKTRYQKELETYGYDESDWGSELVKATFRHIAEGRFATDNATFWSGGEYDAQGNWLSERKRAREDIRKLPEGSRRLLEHVESSKDVDQLTPEDVRPLDTIWADGGVNSEKRLVSQLYSMAFADGASGIANIYAWGSDLLSFHRDTGLEIERLFTNPNVTAIRICNPPQHGGELAPLPKVEAYHRLRDDWMKAAISRLESVLPPAPKEERAKPMRSLRFEIIHCYSQINHAGWSEFSDPAREFERLKWLKALVKQHPDIVTKIDDKGVAKDLQDFFLEGKEWDRKAARNRGRIRQDQGVVKAGGAFSVGPAAPAKMEKPDDASGAAELRKEMLGEAYLGQRPDDFTLPIATHLAEEGAKHTLHLVYEHAEDAIKARRVLKVAFSAGGEFGKKNPAQIDISPERGEEIIIDLEGLRAHGIRDTLKKIGVTLSFEIFNKLPSGSLGVPGPGGGYGAMGA